MRHLNRAVLRRDCFAEARIHVGSRVEVDVGTFQADDSTETSTGANGAGVTVETWAPPDTTLVVPAVFPDVIEVQVFRRYGGHILVGAIELVSPGNKDRPETRREFAAKCASYLQQGVGLLVVDIVTGRRANLHDDLMRLLDHPARFLILENTPVYAAAYRPARRPAGDQIEMWLEPLAVGRPIPRMPLGLMGLPTVPVDLEPTYASACVDSRLP